MTGRRRRVDRFAIRIDVDDELRDALDYYFEAPVGMQVIRADLRAGVKGILEVELGRILLAYRAAAELAPRRRRATSAARRRSNG